MRFIKYTMPAAVAAVLSFTCAVPADAQNHNRRSGSSGFIYRGDPSAFERAARAAAKRGQHRQARQAQDIENRRRFRTEEINRQYDAGMGPVMGFGWYGSPSGRSGSRRRGH
jgi:hypothetical protein